jgi:hypothetical protein
MHVHGGQGTVDGGSAALINVLGQFMLRWDIKWPRPLILEAGDGEPDCGRAAAAPN